MGGLGGGGGEGEGRWIGNESTRSTSLFILLENSDHPDITVMVDPFLCRPEFRSRVNVEVAVFGSTSLISKRKEKEKKKGVPIRHLPSSAQSCFSLRVFLATVSTPIPPPPPPPPSTPRPRPPGDRAFSAAA